MKNYSSAFDSNLSPVEYINLLFENTSGSNILNIPGWYYLNEPECSLRCKIKWDYKDLEKITSSFTDLYEKINRIAEYYKSANIDVTSIRELVVNTELYPTFVTYFSPFIYPEATDDKLDDIADKIETIKTVRIIEEKINSKEKIESYEKHLYEEYKDLKITEEEKELYSDYCRAFYKDCEKRVGENVGAVDLILRARRLLKFIEIGAPKNLINHEACMLAVAYVIHNYATSLEKETTVVKDNTIEYGFMSEEEEEAYLDSLYRPKKRNNRKQMLSLFVYIILAEKSSSTKHLSQQEIIDILKEMPYELTIERKALSRVIHGLEDEGLGIHSDPREGAWHDAAEDTIGITMLDE